MSSAFLRSLPDTCPDELDVDDACFLFTDTLLIFDHVRHRVKIVCNAHVENDRPRRLQFGYLAKIEAIIAKLRDVVRLQ